MLCTYNVMGPKESLQKEWDQRKDYKKGELLRQDFLARLDKINVNNAPFVIFMKFSQNIHFYV